MNSLVVKLALKLWMWWVPHIIMNLCLTTLTGFLRSNNKHVELNSYHHCNHVSHIKTLIVNTTFYLLLCYFININFWNTLFKIKSKFYRIIQLFLHKFNKILKSALKKINKYPTTKIFSFTYLETFIYFICLFIWAAKRPIK